MTESLAIVYVLYGLHSRLATNGEGFAPEVSLNSAAFVVGTYKKKDECDTCIRYNFRVLITN